MKNKKILLIVGAIVLIIIIFVVWMVARKPASQTSQTPVGTGNPGASVQNQTGKLTDNFFKCDIGGKSIDFVIDSATYYAKGDFTMLSGKIVGADVYKGSIMYLTFSGQKPGNLNNNGKESYELNVNATYLDEKTQTWNTNDDNDSAVASITKYSGNNIEGTYTANPALTKPNGQDKNSRLAIKCSFKSSLPIESGN